MKDNKPTNPTKSPSKTTKDVDEEELKSSVVKGSTDGTDSRGNSVHEGINGQVSID
jgi:hypothetical protein